MGHQPSHEQKIYATSKRLCEKSFYHFARDAWNHVDPTPYCDTWHVECLCVHAQAVYNGRIEILDVAIPPGFAKSLVYSVLFPVWVWVNNPAIRFLTGSHDRELAIRDTVKSRDLILSRWFQERWGTVFDLKYDQNTKGNYGNNKGGYRIAISTGSGTTGHRGDIIVYDDGMSVKQANAREDTERNRVIEYFRTSLWSRQDILKATRMINIGQRVHSRDPHFFFLALPGCVHLKLQLEYKPTTAFKSDFFKDPRTVEDEPLWDLPKFSPAGIALLKEVNGSKGYAMQYQQEANEQEGSIIKRAWWRYYSLDTLPQHLTVISSWDFAAKAKQSNDHTVGLMVGKCGADFYFLGMYRKRVEFVDAKKDYITQCDIYRPYKRYVEDTSNGTALISEMASTQYAMMPVSPGGLDKVARVNPITPIIEAGHFHLPLSSGFVTLSISGKQVQIYIDAELVDLFVNECANFPLSKEDDIVDALSQLLNNERQNISPMLSFIRV